MEFLEEMESRFKETEIGLIPEHWEVVKVGDVINSFTPNAKLKQSDYKTFGKFPVIDQSQKYIAGFHDDETMVFDKDLPVILFGDHTRIIKYVDFPFIYGADGLKIIVPKEKFHRKYFYYALLNLNIPSEGYDRHFKILKERLIPLPPLHEQKAIADVLSSIDDKIELLHRQNKTLEKMAMTLFRQWFIEPTKDGLPDGWGEVSLGEIIEISSGKSIEKGKLKEKGLYPVLGANGEIGRVDDWLYEGELIYTGRVGTLGNVFIVFKNEKVWLTDNTLVIRPKKNEYYYFVYFTLKNAKLDEYNSGSTQPLIRQSDIKKMEIFLPKIDLLKDFEAISRNIFTKIQFNTSQIQTLEKLRDTLLPKLMSGEVNIL
ncbi:MAG: restriction endonuclease subunit S [Leptospiraceae bacterium]|nr:restriction endonuclease subunit S [Leptospiraceae bacterium]